MMIYKRQQRQRGDPRFELPLGPASLQALDAYFGVRSRGYCVAAGIVGAAVPQPRGTYLLLLLHLHQCAVCRFS